MLNVKPTGKKVAAGAEISSTHLGYEVRYVVLDEHTLGYIYGAAPRFMGVLAGSVLRGGHDWRNGPVSITPGDPRIRSATLADFEMFRVVPPPGFTLLGTSPETTNPAGTLPI